MYSVLSSVCFNIMVSNFQLIIPVMSSQTFALFFLVSNLEILCCLLRVCAVVHLFFCCYLVQDSENFLYSSPFALMPSDNFHNTSI